MYPMNPMMGGGMNPMMGGGMNPMMGGGMNPMMGGGMNPMMGGGMNPMMGGGVNPMMGGGVNPMMGGGANPMMGGGVNPMMGGGVNPMMGGGGMNPMMGGGGMNPMGYSVNQNYGGNPGLGGSQQQKPQGPQGTFQPVINQQPQNLYGGGLPKNLDLSTNIQANAPQEKKPFDELDDMLGLKNTTNNAGGQKPQPQGGNAKPASNERN